MRIQNIPIIHQLSSLNIPVRCSNSQKHSCHKKPMGREEIKIFPLIGENYMSKELKTKLIALAG